MYSKLLARSINLADSRVESPPSSLLPLGPTISSSLVEGTELGSELWVMSLPLLLSSSSPLALPSSLHACLGGGGAMKRGAGRAPSLKEDTGVSSLLVERALKRTTASSSVSPSSSRLCADTTVSMEFPALLRERVSESLEEEAALGRLTTKSARWGGRGCDGEVMLDCKGREGERR